LAIPDQDDVAQDRAREIAEALGGRRYGRHWWCRCPAHADRTPSLKITVKNGRPLFRCYAKCSSQSVIDALRELGLWPKGASHAHPFPGQRISAPPVRDRDQGSSPAAGLACDPLKPWRKSYAVFHGTYGETYLAERGLDPTDAEIAQLHTHPSLWHWPTQTKWPAMLLLVRKWADSGFVDLTTHQTFLDRDRPRKAPIAKPRLFPAGVSPAGGGVWFGAPGPERTFVVAEGVESLLSALRLLDAVDGCAALSALGIRELILPPMARRVCIFADRDKEGQGLEAARVARSRWQVEGREVRTVQSDIPGEDANNVWLRRLGHG
jgi:hypothetical protein